MTSDRDDPIADPLIGLLKKTDPAVGAFVETSRARIIELEQALDACAGKLLQWSPYVHDIEATRTGAEMLAIIDRARFGGGSS
jgi:hypothetical protein